MLNRIDEVHASTPKKPQLKRTTFRTSRLLDFCSKKELIAQTGHDEFRASSVPQSRTGLSVLQYSSAKLHPLVVNIISFLSFVGIHKCRDSGQA
jgi:hypothetical protein